MPAARLTSMGVSTGETANAAILAAGGCPTPCVWAKTALVRRVIDTVGACTWARWIDGITVIAIGVSLGCVGPHSAARAQRLLAWKLAAAPACVAVAPGNLRVTCMLRSEEDAV